MIKDLKIENFGPLSDITWEKLGKINLIIGGNGSGKTFLLKAIYSTLRTIEDYKRGNEKRSESEILTDKLYWTFQAEKIGDLVSKGAESPLSISMNTDQGGFSYSFGKDTNKQISSLENTTLPRKSNSIFLPAKEVLSLYNIILNSRERDKVFGFDDTYYDLAKALRTSVRRSQGNISIELPSGLIEILGGEISFDPQENQLTFEKNPNAQAKVPDSIATKIISSLNSELIKDLRVLSELTQKKTLHSENSDIFTAPRNKLEEILGGRIEYEKSSRTWVFSKGRHKFPVEVTAEGIKKIAILDALLANGYLDKASIVLIDEPEAALHPNAISQLIDIIASLAEHGIQFFMASHSYFVVKKLLILAQEKKWSIPVALASNNNWTYENLIDGMPQNSIIEESINIYKQEVELAFK